MGGWEIGEGVGWAERGLWDYLDAGLPYTTQNEDQIWQRGASCRPCGTLLRAFLGYTFYLLEKSAGSHRSSTRGICFSATLLVKGHFGRSHHKLAQLYGSPLGGKAHSDSAY
jgi:hypothetical protein